MLETEIVTSEAGEPAYDARAAKVWTAKVWGVHLERYDTPEATDAAFWEPTHTWLQPGEEYFGEDRQGNVVRFTATGAADGMRSVGLWGFCDLSPVTRHPDAGVPVIHFWRNENTREGPVVTLETATGFFAHELSHAVLEPFLASCGGNPNGELLADIVGAIAIRARRLAVGDGQPAPGE